MLNNNDKVMVMILNINNKVMVIMLNNDNKVEKDFKLWFSLF